MFSLYLIDFNAYFLFGSEVNIICLCHGFTYIRFICEYCLYIHQVCFIQRIGFHPSRYILPPWRNDNPSQSIFFSIPTLFIHWKNLVWEGGGLRYKLKKEGFAKAKLVQLLTLQWAIRKFKFGSTSLIIKIATKRNVVTTFAQENRTK